MNAMNGTERFWVVGGEYSDTAFSELKDGSTEIFGPFLSYESACARWRAAAEATRSNACVRYAIARENFA